VMQPLYPINANGPGIAIGRYPEDLYDGIDSTTRGNPWYYTFHFELTFRFLCTNAAAEVIYFTVNEMLQNQSLYTDDLTNIFYKRFVPSINGSTTYPANSSEYQTILQGMVTFADSFMATVQTHAMTNGSLNEEFDR